MSKFFIKPLVEFHPSSQFIKSKRADFILNHHWKIMNRVKLDYMKSVIDIPNEHPLMVAVKQINAITDDLFRAWNLARDQVAEIAGALGWYGGLGNGKFLDRPYFYHDPNTPEIIILTEFEDSYDIIMQQLLEEDKNYWTSWEPVRARYHVYTDMDYYPTSIPYSGGDYNRRISTFKGEVNIIEVDLALLWLQWRYWKNSTHSKFSLTDESVGPKPMGSFFVSYPLANMIESQMEIAYFNRMNCYFTGKEIMTSRKLHKRHDYINTYQSIDDSIIEVLKNYKKYGGMNFDKTVTNLPSLTGVNYGEFFKPIQNSWGKKLEAMIAYSCIPLYEIWWKLIAEMQQQKWNATTISDIKKGLKIMKNEKVYQAMGDYKTNQMHTRFNAFEKLINGEKGSYK